MQCCSRPDLTRPVPLFPLPNVVLFPTALLPLHAFEPRYRLMMHDCVQQGLDRRLITMALLHGDYREKYYTNHAVIHPVACLGRVLRHEVLSDGRYNLILQGLCRVRILSEDRSGPYRLATLQALDSVEDSADPPTLAQLRMSLHRILTKGPLAHLTTTGQLGHWCESNIPLGQLTDLIAYHLLDRQTDLKQALLVELDVARRAQHLLSCLQTMGVPAELTCDTRSYWPPTVGVN